MSLSYNAGLYDKLILLEEPETMLWTLHNRATEAMRSDGIIDDEKAIEIYKSINYDYENNFGKAEPSHAVRSLIFDKAIQNFLKQYPESTIVNLGEGLETQRFRFKDEHAKWLSVDVPEAIEIRESFIDPDQRHIHCPVSAFDKKWFNEITDNKPVFITAQGLFMYFKEKDVKSLIGDITKAFQTGYIMFDTIPEWLSKKTLSEKGWQKTEHYTTPPMPWGINRDQINTLKNWSTNITGVSETFYNFPRGMQKWMFNAMLLIPGLNKHAPTILTIAFNNSKDIT
jgi:O-methyltransferase involved in polyketide biosynthesis